MTQQHIAGELSSLLADLHPPAGEWLDAVDRLRREIEHAPLAALPMLAREALSLADSICWAALAEGDANGFSRYCDAAGALRDFGLSARLLP